MVQFVNTELMDHSQSVKMYSLHVDLLGVHLANHGKWLRIGCGMRQNSLTQRHIESNDIKLLDFTFESGHLSQTQLGDLVTFLR
jgi:hypothetical protein